MPAIVVIIVFCLLLAVLKTVILAGAVALGLIIVAGLIFQPATTLTTLSFIFAMYVFDHQPVLLAALMVVVIVGNIVSILRGG